MIQKKNQAHSTHIPDALTSSTRTDFTYPPIEDLTKTLLKYAKNANLRKLAYPTDLQARRRHFNTFIDNLRIVCNISRGRAKSLIFGQNKCPIHTLCWHCYLQFDLHKRLTLARNTSLMAHQMLELQF
ncbi:hypothetical protein MHU86_20777 [Fragilaria crotonensis]|nr:hypothetical protein MHU86_20777 [Fragilaria crotonensis]